MKINLILLILFPAITVWAEDSYFDNIEKFSEYLKNGSTSIDTIEVRKNSSPTQLEEKKENQKGKGAFQVGVEYDYTDIKKLASRNSGTDGFDYNMNYSLNNVKMKLAYWFNESNSLHYELQTGSKKFELTPTAEFVLENETIFSGTNAEFKFTQDLMSLYYEYVINPSGLLQFSLNLGAIMLSQKLEVSQPPTKINQGEHFTSPLVGAALKINATDSLFLLSHVQGFQLEQNNGVIDGLLAVGVDFGLTTFTVGKRITKASVFKNQTYISNNTESLALSVDFRF